MNESHRGPDEREVRELLRAARDERLLEPPPFRRMWRRAESAARPRRVLPRTLPAVAALAAALTLAVLVPRWYRPTEPEAGAEVMELARALSELEPAPLDFLLELPGSGLYGDALGLTEPALDLPMLTFDTDAAVEGH